jgi:protein-tyrosine phosphatase
MSFAAAMNFRDLGGKRAQDGRRTRSGQLFRAGTLSYLDDIEAGLLRERLGLEAYWDLRVDREVQRDGPPATLVRAGVRWERLPIDSFYPDFKQHRLPEIAHWTALYIKIFEDHRPTYNALLRAAAVSGGPMVFGCAAGKDRTGIGAAVLLGCLLVEEEEILADYTQTTIDIMPHVERFQGYWAKGKPSRTREAFIKHYLTAPTEILAGFLAEVTRRWGTVETALREAGLEAPVLEVLRERYLVA